MQRSYISRFLCLLFFFFQAEDGIRVGHVTGVQTCALPILCGDDEALTEKILRLTHGRGLDAAIITVPSNALVAQAQTWLRGGGQLMLFAHTRRGERLELDPAAVCVDEKDLLGSYSADFTLQREVARLVFSRKLDVRPLITHRF